MRGLLTLIFLTLPLYLTAQSLSVADFIINEHDLTAVNEATKEVDDNGETCALIKVETTQKGFYFDGGTVGIAKVDENHPSETWVYVPWSLRRISIMHNELGMIRDYQFPLSLQAGRTYIMKLIVGTVQTLVNQRSNHQWLVLTYTPHNALVEIDGMIVEGSDGQLNHKLQYGNHQIRVSANNYHSEVMAVTIGKDKCFREIQLQPAFGWIEVKGPEGASVFINNSKVGEAPFRSQSLPSGTYDVKVMKERWLPYREQVVVSDNQVSSLDPHLMPNSVTVTLQTGLDAEIWVNEEKQGNGSVTMVLTLGEYHFETHKPLHMSQSIVTEITLTTGDTLFLPTPILMTGSLSIEVKPIGAKVYLDDKYVGESPLILDDIVIGEHMVKATSLGLYEEERSVEVIHGQPNDVFISMNKMREPTDYPGVLKKDGLLLKVPEEFQGDFVIGPDVTTIGDDAFRGCAGLTGVIIPDNVRKIGKCAFYGCKGLTVLNIPNSVDTICDWAFGYCSAMTRVTLPDSLTYISECMFYKCSGLKDILIPKRVKSIGEDAFCYCTGLTKVAIPEGVTKIDWGAFRGCSGLTAVTIPNSVTSLAEDAFNSCGNLTMIDVPICSKKRFKKMLPMSLWNIIIER